MLLNAAATLVVAERFLPVRGIAAAELLDSGKAMAKLLQIRSKSRS